MITDMKSGGADAGALGAKTARACDSCLRRRARWFCAADDAFLCHGCDNLVHSANQLASRHERVRLQTASAKVTTTTATAKAWHSGFTRKARTPRHNKNSSIQQQQQRLKEKILFNTSFLPLVPELGGEEEEEDRERGLLVDINEIEEEEEEQLLCRVPVYDVDPFDLENCNVKNDAADFEDMCDLDSFCEFDVDLAEFAANVESLLGVGSSEIHENSTEQVFDYKQENEMDPSKNEILKVKDEELDDLESVFDMTSDEVFHWNMDHDESMVHQEKEFMPLSNSSVGVSESVITKEETKRERFLRLNYEDVISAWSRQGSPSLWTTANPPKFNSDDDSWQNFLGSSGVDGEIRSIRGNLIGSNGDGGREARVSRYREKRRTRLFAKKIRYEVRKLNAEKRPRMKGRFVKRTTCFAGGATPFPTNYH
ncbi:zinc finger protein CONSTANS-LIKE 16 [Lathyrus oleraceus]|uniref:Zinc finger protein CONSTANS-LIKE 16 n=1 Tax=Pisum sativum TaxID=3888 RepID=A0A9D4VHS7_PEA|nr:zinc finger protein CONSTANS-LIKE 16-like [Pisum sativum]KAI5382915.1 hypothetical protein KIW84_070358 [Pisum sativum]